MQNSLTVHSISKSYGIQPILTDISFTLNAGERLGLVGPNGCGKTTLLHILMGKVQPDTGRVQWNPPFPRVGYLPQGFVPDPQATLESFLSHLMGDLTGLSSRLEALAAALAQDSHQPALQREYDRVLTHIEAANQDSRLLPTVLGALGLDQVPLQTPIAALSGGQKTRLALAGVLLSNPQFLLLDEPTNHLDIDMLEWLEDWLAGFPNAALVVSHDRAFLDQVATGILELDPSTHSLRAYAGNYTDFLEQKLAESERQWQVYSDQQEEKARLRNAIARVRGDSTFRRGGKADSGDKFAKGFFANRAKGTIARAKHLEARLEHLLTDEKVEKPRQSWQMKLGFGATRASGREVLRTKNLSAGYDERALLSRLDLHLRYGERVALIGQNGSGKTTLLRTLIGILPPLAGEAHLGANVRLGYMAQEQENLDPASDAFTTLRRLAPFSETEARAFLHQFLFSGDEVFVPIERLSYGERSRLMLACLVAQGCNLLVLDEPINHLDIPSRARFEQALASFDGTVLAVVHDRYFIEGFATEIWEVQNGGIKVLPRSI